MAEDTRLEFYKLKDQLPIPDTPIPLGVETKRALNHGYVRFRDLFNERQLLNLGKILDWVSKVENWNLKEFLLLAFSNCLKYNNMFAKYNSTRGFITDIFRTHSYSPSMAPVEANCYDTSKGRGAFTAFVNLVMEGKAYCRQPFERVIKKDGSRKVQFETPIIGKLATSFDDIHEPGSVLLQCGSSESIDIPSKSVDAVITDPPYAGNVMYSELSNFFYVWLRIVLRTRYDSFKGETVPWQAEVIENRAQKKGKKEFVEGLTRVFSEACRVLKDEGILVFTFHHKRSDAWALVLKAILNSGFYITASYPVRSEMRASTHLHQMKNITMDMVLVCRKRRRNPPERSWKSIKAEILKASWKLIANATEQGETFSSLDIFVLAFGKCLEEYSKHYPNVNAEGGSVSMKKALDSIKEAIESQILSF
jgi:adenine-specific DNA methylase